LSQKDRIPARLDRAAPLWLAAIVIVFGGLYAKLGVMPPPAFFVLPDAPARAAASTPRYRMQTVSTGATRFAHAPTAVELSDGRLRAFWFGGSREGATDSAIYSALYSPDTDAWSSETAIVTPVLLQRDLDRLVRKVGNPVVVRDVHNRLWLFVVSVTVGGWSGSSINVLMSDDDGKTWGPARRLVTSPFFNLSTLVKGAAFLYADGSIGLPVYHELIGKFGELLRLSPAADVLGKQRLSAGRYSLQPVVVPRTPTEAIGFMRYAGEPPNRVLAFATGDAGRHWGQSVKTELPNPNAAVDALRLDDGALLLAFNNTESNRNDLSLAHSTDGQKWRVIHRIEYVAPAADGQTAEFSYPRLLRGRDGVFHLLYSAGKGGVRHVRFNSAWLEAAIATSLSRGPRLDPLGEAAIVSIK
jgi:predicted neuraminidase